MEKFKYHYVIFYPKWIKPAEKKEGGAANRKADSCELQSNSEGESNISSKVKAQGSSEKPLRSNLELYLGR